MANQDEKDPDPLIGRVLAGRYRLETRLGGGGMGVVYRATQIALDRVVVVKVVRPQRQHDVEAGRRFEREARTLAALNHPHIVSVFDSGADDDGLLFIVMESLEGTTLSTRLKTAPRSSSAWAVKRISEIAAALSAAHASGVVHRDLKPANIFLVSGGGAPEYVKVLDFGLARAMDRPVDEDSITESGMLVGTPGYVSPEQIDGDEADARSDLYALGVIWYELITGVNPFRADSNMKTLMRHLEERPCAPSTHVADISPETDELILRLLAKDPVLRPQSADALLTYISALTGSGNAIASLAPDAPTDVLVVPRTKTREQSSSVRRPLQIAPTLLALAAIVFSLAGPSTATLSATEVRPVSIEAIVPLEPVDGLEARTVDLGRILYEAPELSGSRTIACTSCHAMSAGGTTPEPFTKNGESHSPLDWNTPTTLNACYSFRQLWTAQVEELGAVVDRPLFNPALMRGGTWPEVIARLKSAPHLVQAFADANFAMNPANVRTAIAAYMCQMVPLNSRFDRSLRGEARLTSDEEEGYRRFVEYGCVSCHQGRNVGANMTAKFGVGVESPFTERGRCADATFCWEDADCNATDSQCDKSEHQLRPQDVGIGGTTEKPTYIFKVPSLRNIALTAPYFHDGSARTLRSAIRVMGRNQLGRDLTDDDVKFLTAFLRTLAGELP